MCQGLTMNGDSCASYSWAVYVLIKVPTIKVPPVQLIATVPVAQVQEHVTIHGIPVSSNWSK